ncbi:hypothetical protein METBIDRAFT_30034 [Metschnikowia bicuspidata var. bicuspidata NRRL YB-4993]|uniref:Uncharacterized protein n=1 Tax=Metschnikowia bicuspidata var. bicuspidata NRRL YB-4993 TaxID=869754 RepID=A0A1A0HHE2_9ASCO|nr:hypothetical protein METBIDRAFT_30034 [Metschnikowia bicuspidata var. bicuspidata NRRL YB-4993]OBA23599.1 hypothetical protein METBIDRAFT_30034 [Metschnikowia bicuspidata var. bicuspidata NRRL YB-4993]
MLKDKTLSLKLNKSFQVPDGPFTPVEQTLQTPVAAPNQNSYFAFPSLDLHHGLSFFSQAQDNESDDVMTDIDEAPLLLLPKVLRNYSVSFNASFDQILMTVYSHILLLPTTTPFLGLIPPLGLASRVANETLQRMILESDPMSGKHPTVFDAQGTLNNEQLRNNATAPIVLQLIRKRLLDLCSAQKAPKSKSGSAPVSAVTSIQIAVPATSGSQNIQNNSIYSGLGLRQLSISTLLLNEQNTANYQQMQTGQASQSAVLANSRLRSSSLDLRKHSLTRNNSHTGSNWLHVGNMANVRSGGGLGMNPELASSSDSLQLMNDFVPHALLTRTGSSLSNIAYNQGLGAASGFNPIMMDYQTPPTSSKSSISQGSSSPLVNQRENACLYIPGSAGSFSDIESSAAYSRTQSLNRDTNLCSFPTPLRINTDVAQQSFGAPQNPGFGGNTNGEVLHSPFVSAIPVAEDFDYFGQSNSSTSTVPENVLPKVGSLRSGSLGSDTLVKEASENKFNIQLEYSLSEKKRDSLKMKRGIL